MKSLPVLESQIKPLESTKNSNQNFKSKFQIQNNSTSIITTYSQDSSRTTVALSSHPYFSLHTDLELHMYMLYLSNTLQCQGKPIIITMAKVKSPLYWSLIENFIFTMLKFGLYHCSVMVCISDERCMKLCRENSFPW
jgi:hypothetical protein